MSNDQACVCLVVQATNPELLLSPVLCPPNVWVEVVSLIIDPKIA